MEYIGLEKFTEKRIQALLDCYLKETFIYSNFNKYNKEEHLEFFSRPIITNDNITFINSGVKNIKNQPLIITDKYSL